VARILRDGFGMKIGAFDALFSKEKVREMGFDCAPDFDGLFRAADVLTLHIPFTEENAGIVNKRTLGLMKRGAFLVNFSRGGLHVERDLYEALRDGVIAGAALDAFVPEPPDFSHPLYSLPNVVLSPHTAGTSEDARRRMSVNVARGIDDVLSGRVPEFCANRAELYS
jgi:phosphoglycerate dehydrogenase-like enzyme